MYANHVLHFSGILIWVIFISIVVAIQYKGLFENGHFDTNLSNYQILGPYLGYSTSTQNKIHAAVAQLTK